MAETNTSAGGGCCAPTSSISEAELISAVEFETDTRPHISLNVLNLRKSLAFYMAFFNEKPVKLKDDYAKFELKQPPLNLTLNVHEDNYDKNTEYGLQLINHKDIDEIRSRFSGSEYNLVDNGKNIFISDPEGNRWEIYS